MEGTHKLATKETRWRGGSEREGKRESGFKHTLLVKNEDVAAVQVDGVSGTQAGHYTTRTLSVEASWAERIMRGKATYIHRRPQ